MALSKKSPASMRRWLLVIVVVIGTLSTYVYHRFTRVDVRGDVSRIKSPIVLFDFDGTVCDSLNDAIEIFNRVAPEYDATPLALSKEEIRKTDLKNLLKKQGVSSLRLPFLVRRMRKEMEQHIDQIRIFPGMTEFFQSLKMKGFLIGIVTSNALENVERFLKINKIKGVDLIVSGGSLFGKDRLLRKVLEGASLQPNQVVYVGDEVRDIEAARAVGCKFIGATWGYHDSTLLKKSGAGVMVNAPEEGMQVLSELF